MPESDSNLEELTLISNVLELVQRSVQFGFKVSKSHICPGESAIVHDICRSNRVSKSHSAVLLPSPNVKIGILKTISKTFRSSSVLNEISGRPSWVMLCVVISYTWITTAQFICLRTDRINQEGNSNLITSSTWLGGLCDLSTNEPA